MLIEQPVSGLDAGGATVNAPVEIAANAELSNLTIDAPAGNAHNHGGRQYQCRAGRVTVHQNEADVNAARNCAILAAGYNNLTLLVEKFGPDRSESQPEGHQYPRCDRRLECLPRDAGQYP
ncbi:MAG: hypothetical protein ACLR8Y_00720 [Alistipes indistinctus]